MYSEVDKHPAYYPDINPIGHVWDEENKRLQEQCPKSVEATGGKQRIKQWLAEVLRLLLDTIPEECFDKLWKSMPGQVEAVIHANRWHAHINIDSFLVFFIHLGRLPQIYSENNGRGPLGDYCGWAIKALELDFGPHWQVTTDKESTSQYLDSHQPLGLIPVPGQITPSRSL